MPRNLRAALIPVLVILFTCTTSLIPVAEAVLIDTPLYLTKQGDVDVDELQQALQRQDVREQLVALGVDPDAAGKRIASLDAREVRQLQQAMRDLPAGSDALAILGAVLLVLIVLEILGVTNVFNKL